MTILAGYRELINSPEQLAFCRKASSLDELLLRLKQLWRHEHLSHNELVIELNQCNSQVISVDVERLSGSWMPCEYRPKSRSLKWCLALGAPTEPFHDQYVERCGQIPLNQLIRPQTPLRELQASPAESAAVPAGFIFHLSRCGSTLLSGCLAEAEDACVLSESQLLTEILLDASLAEAEKRQLLPSLISLQGRRESSISAHNVIKWNAWDILFWPLIRSVFPAVPAVLVIRDPKAILASHRREPGRHMAGDPAMAVLGPEFALRDDAGILDFRLRVLRTMMEQMLAGQSDAHTRVVDYTSLSPARIAQIGSWFGLSMPVSTQGRIAERLRYHSKRLQEPFDPGIHLVVEAPPDEMSASNALYPLYKRLLNGSFTGRTAHVKDV